MFDLAQTLRAACARDPDRLAIVDSDLRLTYAQWLARIERVAGELHRRGISRSDHVVTVMQNRYELATLHWACQLLGAIITPVNWRATSEDLDYIVEDAEAKVVVFDPVSEPAVAGSRTRADTTLVAAAGASFQAFGPVGNDEQRLSWGAFCEPAGEPDHGRAFPGVGVEATSVMLYTSGTTGRGKGVPRSHGAERAAALAHVAQNQYAYGEVTLGVMPLYHTMGVRSLLSMALINGTFICLPRFSVEGSLALIERERITNLYLVPTLYHDLVKHPAFDDTDTSSVRKLGFAGAPMTDGLVGRVRSLFKPDLFVNHYGSSEIYTFTIEPRAAEKPGSAGKAGLNQDIRVVAVGCTDPDAMLGPGEEGQIIARLSGDEAFAGYWKRPDADEKALHAGWYFTGDTGHFDADRDLFVTGRVDDMVISGGENISPVEIESVLSLHPAVSEVSVVGLPDERWGQRVTAFIVRSAQVSAETLDEHCRSSDLADFKRPREFIFVRGIPKSPVGKILRRLLVAGEYEPDAE